MPDILPCPQPPAAALCRARSHRRPFRRQSKLLFDRQTQPKHQAQRSDSHHVAKPNSLLSFIPQLLLCQFAWSQSDPPPCMGDARTTREEAGFPSLPCSWAPVLLPHVDRRASASSAIQRRPPNARQPRKTPQERDQTANRERHPARPRPQCLAGQCTLCTRYLSSYRPTWRAAPRRGYHRSWATQGPARLPGSPSRQSSVYSPALVACSGEHAIRLIVYRHGSDARAASSNTCLLCTEYWQRGQAAGCWHRRGGGWTTAWASRGGPEAGTTSDAVCIRRITGFSLGPGWR